MYLNIFAEGPRHSKIIPCSETDRQTNRGGTKGPRPNVNPLWGMATLVRRSNKMWSPGPLQSDLRGDDLGS